jgi:putative spermidine/putrescine transport system substrate-binding protein
MQRRSFLITLGSMAIGAGLTGCQGRDPAILRVLALKHSLPPQLLGEFNKYIQPSHQIELGMEAQFKEIFTQLQEWHKTGLAAAKGLKLPLFPPAKAPEYIPNLVTMGDAWLQKAIQEKLIQPIDPQNLTNWGKLEPRWRELAQRDNLGNSSSTGQIWGIPYRWGTTAIVYRRDKLAEAKIAIPQDWEDLWNPQLRRRISVLDRSREVIGLTLKKLGHSYNHTDLTQVSNLKSELEKLDRQVKFYSADNYLQPLILGETWVAVGWSFDILDLVKRNPTLGAIVPRSGTAIFADLWVQPTVKSTTGQVERMKLAERWLDYCLQPKVSSQISLFTSGTAPALTNAKSDEILPDIQKDPLILPPKTILDKCDFIYPLSATNQAQYDRLWKEVRLAKLG